MSTDITPYVNASLEEKRAYAQMLSAAGDLLPKAFLGQVRNADTGNMEQRMLPGKILMIAETGAMLGIHPMAAIQGIDVIEGNPTIKPSLMSALVRERGMQLRSWITGTIEGGDIAAHATLVRPDDPEFTYKSTWTPFDAIRAGKVDSYQPDDKGVWHVRARSKSDSALPWEAFTKRMLRWRVIGDVCSEGAEDVLLGVHYMPDELTDNVTAEGNYVQVPSVPTEDWEAQVKAADSVEAMLDVKTRAGAEWDDRLNTLMLSRAGEFRREPVEVTFETTDEPSGEAPELEAEPVEPVKEVADLDPADPRYVEAEATK